MKYVYSIILITIVLSCKAQSNIVPIGSSDYIENNSNYYLKDVNNEFNKFEGTWLYNNGNIEIIFKLRKEVHYQLGTNHYFQDLLVGEYKYEYNNIEIVNSLSYLDNPNISGYEHNISGASFQRWLPDNCIDNSQPSEIKIWLIITHPNNLDIEGRLILRYVNESGVEKIQACIYDETVFSYGDDDRIPIPDGYYEFIKQD